jgi:nucleotide-binding universal stress UspA family protein
LQKLLVATDFSTRSDRAIRRATLLARKLGASLRLVHVVDGDQSKAMIDSDVQVAGRILDESSSTLRSHDGVEVDWAVTIDDVQPGILAAADDYRADLIIVGPNRPRFRDIFIGTTAERMVQRTTRPLLVAVNTPTAHYRHTLLALDFDEASKAAARRALEIGIFDHTDVVVMHAFDAPAEGRLRTAMEEPASIDQYVEQERRSATGKFKALLSELGLPDTCQIIVSMGGTPAGAIVDAAKDSASELIVMGANQRTGLERAFVGSVAADVIRDAHRDILIIPADPEA